MNNLAVKFIAFFLLFALISVFRATFIAEGFLQTWFCFLPMIILAHPILFFEDYQKFFDKIRNKKRLNTLTHNMVDEYAQVYRENLCTLSLGGNEEIEREKFIQYFLSQTTEKLNTRILSKRYKGYAYLERVRDDSSRSYRGSQEEEDNKHQTQFPATI